MNESLEKLTKSLTDLSQLYRIPGIEKSEGLSVISPSGAPGQTSSPAMFLSQVPVQQYYNAEEAFTTQLTSYTKKQFFQVCASLLQ